MDIIEKGCTMINKYYDSEFHCLKFVFVETCHSCLPNFNFFIFLYMFVLKSILIEGKERRKRMEVWSYDMDFEVL